jgi:hypothetical protein
MPSAPSSQTNTDPLTTRPEDEKPALPGAWFRCWWLAAIVLAAVSALEHRHFVGQDGMTYLDMARECLRNGPGTLIQPMWNPLYPAILAVWMALFRPSPQHEISLVHLANWVLFAVMAACFVLFLRSWREWRHRRLSPQSTISRHLESLFGFSVFLWIFMDSAWPVTPDLVVAGCVFLASWCCVRMADGASSWRFPVLMGVVLGLGYYAKPAGIPIAGLLLAALCVRPPGAARRQQVLKAAAAFVLVTLPLIAGISRSAGHLTTSESGKLNYVWHVNEYFPFYGWTGQGSPDHGTPLHPPRVLMQHPLTIEFASPVKGTYPLWFDPSYWYAGVQTRFDLRQEASTIVNHMVSLYGLAAEQPYLWAGVFALVILGWRQKSRLAVPSDVFWVLAWPVAVIGTFSLIHVEPRYIQPFNVLLAIGAYSVLIRSLDRTANGVLLVLSVLMLLVVITSASFSAVRALREMTAHRPTFDESLAERLASGGVGEGDRIAVVGYSFDAYWAHLGGMHIAAQVLDQDQFWKMDDRQLEDLTARLKQLLVKAIVARGGPPSPGGPWQELPAKSGELYRVLLLK